jgi:dihydroorotase
VTPHHLLLTHESVQGYDTQAKMNPPLRSAGDVRALRAALASGTVDVVATDHAPHHYDEKEREFDYAPFGILGLETAFGLLHTELVLGEGLPLVTLVERMSAAPARIFHLPGGTLAPGTVADVAVLDLEERWTVDPESFLSRSRNTPFGGRHLTGRPWATIVEGRLAWSSGAGVPAPERRSVPRAAGAQAGASGGRGRSRVRAPARGGRTAT